MADVRIGIHSTFDSAGFDAAIKSVSQLQKQLKAMQSSVDKINKATGGKTIAQQMREAERAAKAQQKATERAAKAQEKAIDNFRKKMSKVHDDLAKAEMRAQASIDKQRQAALNKEFNDQQKALERAKQQQQKALEAVEKQRQKAYNQEFSEIQKEEARQAKAQQKAADDQVKREQKALDSIAKQRQKANNQAFADEQREAQRQARLDQQNADARVRQQQKTYDSLFNQKHAALANPAAQQAAYASLMQQSYGDDWTKRFSKNFDAARIELTRFQQLMQRMPKLPQINFGAGAAAGLNALISAATRAASALTKLAATARSAAAALLGGIGSAARSVSNLLGRISSSANTGLTKLRTSLMSAGKSAIGFGKDMQNGMSSADKSLERSAAGWSLLLAGRTLSSAGGGILSGKALGIDDYLSLEAWKNRAAIAGYSSDPNVKSSTMGDITEFITGMARGSFGGAPVKNLSLEEMTQGAYYLSSAIGLPINQQNMGSVAQMLNPMLQVAGYTQTSPETMIKGALNMAMEFGIDPKNMNNSGMMGQIASTMGYLANASTMEVPDIVEAFKMMGPMMNRVVPGDGSQTSGFNNMTDAMAWTYFASNAGLRGSSIGRSLDMFTSRLLDPTGPAMEAASAAFGIEPSQNAWRQFFFDGNGDLKGGLSGAIDKFIQIGVDNPALQDALIAEMFPQNAQRGLLAVMSGLSLESKRGGSDTPWQDFTDLLRDGKAEEAMAMLDQAIKMSNQTLGSATQNMQNAWQTMSGSIIDSIKGPMIDGLDTLSNVFFELSDVITDFPEIGKVFAGFGVGLGAVLSITGALLSFAGVILVLNRALMFLGGTGQIAFSLLAAIPSILLTGIPVLLAMAAALVMLKSAWDSNLLGVQDFVNFLKTGDISDWFANSLIPSMDGTIIQLNKMRVAFSEFVNGILLGNGSTNNLGAFMTDLFGQFLGPALYGKLIQFQGFLTGLRASIKSFFTGLSGGDIKNAAYALQGFFELLFMGQTSARNMSAFDQIGDALGIDDLTEKIVTATDRIRGVINNLIDSLQPAFESIKESLGEIFDGDLTKGLLDFAEGFAKGFGAAIVTSIYAVGQGLAFVLQQLSQLGSYGTQLQGFIQGLTGVKVGIEEIGMVAGIVFGGMIAGNILSAFTPLAGIVSILAGVGVGILQLGMNAAITAARVALLAVSFAASGAASLLMMGPIGLLAGALLIAGAAIVGFIAYTSGLNGVFQLIAGGAGLVGSALSYLASNISTIVGVVAVAGAALAALGIAFAVIYLTLNPVTAVMLGVAVAIAVLVAVLQAFGVIDFAGIGDGLLNLGQAALDAMTQLGEALANTDSIDQAEELMGAALDYYFDSLILKFTTRMGELLEIGRLLVTAVPGIGQLAGIGLEGIDKFLNDPLVTGAKFNAASSKERYESLLNTYSQPAEQTTKTAQNGVTTVTTTTVATTTSVSSGIENNPAYGTNYGTNPLKSPGFFGLPQDVMSGTAIPRATPATAPYNLSDYQYSPSQQFDPRADQAWWSEAAAYISNRTPKMGVGGKGYSAWLGQTILGGMSASIGATGGVDDAYLPWLVSEKPDWFAGMTNEQINRAGKGALATYNNQLMQPYNGLSGFGFVGEISSVADPMWLPVRAGQTPPKYGAASPMTGNGSSLNAIGGGAFPLTPANFGGPTSTINQGLGTMDGGTGIGQIQTTNANGFTLGQQMAGLYGQAGLGMGGVIHDYGPLSIAPGLGMGGVLRQLQVKESPFADIYNTVKGFMAQFGDSDIVQGIYDLLGIDPDVKPEAMLQSLLSGQGMAYDSALQGMPKPIQDMLAKYQKEQNLKKLANGQKGFEALSGGWFGGGGITSPEDFMNDMIAEAEKAEQKANDILAFNQQLAGTYMPADLPAALQNTFNNGPRIVPKDFDMMTGAIPQYVSGAQAAASYSQALLAGLPEGSTQDIWELLGDYIGIGNGEGNILGKNLKNQFMGDEGFQQWLAESGSDWSAISAQLPQYYHDEAYMPSALQDMSSIWGGLSKTQYNALDQGLGIDWANLGQYAVSQAQNGIRDWNLADFIAEEYGVSLAQANQMIADTSAQYGTDIGNAIGGEMFSNTQTAVNSALGTVNIIDDSTWDILGEQLAAGTSKILEVTQAQFDALDVGQKQALSQAGYVFRITADAEVDTSPAEQAASDARQRVSDAFESAFSDPIEAAIAVDAVVKANPMVAGQGDGSLTSPVNFDPSMLINQNSMDWYQDYGNNPGMVGAGYGYLEPLKPKINVEPEIGEIPAIGTLLQEKINAQGPITATAQAQINITTLPFTGAGPLAGGGSGPALGSLNPFGGTDASAALAPMVITITVTADTAQATAAIGAVTQLLTTLSGTTATPSVAAETSGATSALQSLLNLLRQVSDFNATPTVTVGGGAEGALSGILGQLQAIDGYSATATVTTIQTTVTQTIAGGGGGAVGSGPSAFASGGWATGLILVGEEGPELMDLGSNRAYIHDADETRSMITMSGSPVVASASAGDVININVTGPQYYSNDMDVKRMVDIVEEELGKRNKKAERAQVPAS